MTPEDVVSKNALYIAEELKDATPSARRELDIAQYKILKKAEKGLEKYLRDNSRRFHIVIGGSTAAYVQTKNFRKPKDIDLNTHYVNIVANHLATILRKKYGDAVYVEPMKIIQHGNTQYKLIQIKIRDENRILHDAIDVKSESPSTMGFMDFSLSPIKVHFKPITIKGYQYEPISELIRKKAVSVKEKYADRIKQGVLPTPRAKKDIDDFISMSESVPEFKQKHLNIPMQNLKNNLRYYGSIPKEQKEIDPRTEKKKRILPPDVKALGLEGFI